MAKLKPDDPSQIGSYEIRERLGAGGMGVVYLGHRNGKFAAVKVMAPKFASDPTFRARFRREIEAAKKIQGPFIAKILDANPEGDSYLWYACEYIPGPTLQEAVETSLFKGKALDQLAYSLYQVMASIHKAGVIHRDWKPSNIILGPNGVRAIDFGVAYTEDSPNLTMTGEVLGTPSYMAPEQFGRDKPHTSWDIFAFGSLLVYAATGRPPYTGINSAAVIAAIANPNVKPNLAGVPVGILSLVRRCLEHEPTNRATLEHIRPYLPATQTAIATSTAWMPPRVSAKVQNATRIMTKLEHDLAPTRKGPVPARPAAKPQPRKKPGGHDVLLWAAGVMVAVTAVLGGTGAFDGDDKPTTPKPALSEVPTVEIPLAGFAASKLTGKGNPKVTKVVTENRKLRVTIQFTGTDEVRKTILTKACLKVTYSKSNVAVIRANTRVSESNLDVIDFGSGLDYPGDVYFFAKCSDENNLKGGQKLGRNKVAYDGTFGTEGTKGWLVPVTDAYTKGGKLKVVVPTYFMRTDAQYLAMCLKTPKGHVKPTFINAKAEHGDRWYKLLTFNAKSGELYLSCSGKKKISYTGKGVVVP